MKLRYIVETKFTNTFTVTKEISSDKEAQKIIKRLQHINKREKRMVYSNFKLYDNQNKELKLIT